MTTKRKCFKCDETINKPLSDFYLIGWNAFSLGKEKATIACLTHSHLLVNYVTDRLIQSKGGNNEN